MLTRLSVSTDGAFRLGPLDSLEGVSSQPAREALKETSNWFRPDVLIGVEALHATFHRHRYRPHAHPTWTVALLRRGAAAFDLEGRDYVAPPGSVFILAPELVHTGYPASEGGYSYEVLYLDPGRLAELADAAASSAPRLPRQVVLHDRSLAAELRALHASLRAEVPDLGLEVSFTRVAEAVWQHLKPAPRPRTEQPDHPAVGRAVELLRERWADPVNLTELAAHAGLAPSALVRQFHRAVGMPPHSFQLNLRVLKARELLRRGQPAVEVAYQTGFYDQAHLTRVFKHSVGVPPDRFARARPTAAVRRTRQ